MANLARLTLKFKDKVLKAYQFKSGITIGRIKGNDIVIENPAVSGKHALIDVIDDHFILKDQGSKNGVFVNNKKVQEYELKEGDKVTVGKHTLEFDFGPGGILIGSEEKKEQEFSGMTVCLDTRQFKQLTEEKAGKNTEPIKTGLADGREGKAPTVKGKIITELESTGRPTEMLLEKEVSVIGKKADADFRIHGFLCGTTAAAIERKKNQFIIKFMGGFAKLKVNGKVVSTGKVLTDGDEITIGSNRLVFKKC